MIQPENKPKILEEKIWFWILSTSKDLKESKDKQKGVDAVDDYN